tara:strand:+ start:55139 stop:55450 length:312 start_codon:yes stop_codon:yes gene_type:complete
MKGRHWCLLGKRWKLWIASNKICGICEKVIDDYEESSVDHILPKSRGGKDNTENLQITHLKCNNQKGNLLPWQAKVLLFIDRHFFKVRSGRLSKRFKDHNSDT